MYRFQKNATEEVRVSLTEYLGHKLIDIRVYYQGEDDEYHPTKKGLSISVEKFNELKESIKSIETTLKKKKLLIKDNR
ncbi:transcriptional coactivator p15 [candidate division KSB1 bacterium]|nr:MAG: transcriptional coactivator p15 [candidate division KSB1 bacterium]